MAPAFMVLLQFGIPLIQQLIKDATEHANVGDPVATTQVLDAVGQIAAALAKVPPPPSLLRSGTGTAVNAGGKPVAVEAAPTALHPLPYGTPK